MLKLWLGGIVASILLSFVLIFYFAVPLLALVCHIHSFYIVAKPDAVEWYRWGSFTVLVIVATCWVKYPPRFD